MAYSGPTIFLPTDPTFDSFGVIKAPDAQPGQIALEGTFYPTFALGDGLPRSVFGDAVNPLMSLFVYTGDLGLDDGGSQSVYVLDKSNAEQLMQDDGQPLRLDMRPGDTVELPDGLGTVTFDGVQRWNKLQISETPGKLVALAGVVLALVGLLGSLFIRPRRVWVRARAEDGATVVDVAALDRSNGGDPDRGAAELAAIMDTLRAGSGDAAAPPRRARDRRIVGDPQQPGGRGRRGRLLPGADGAPRPVGVAAQAAGRRGRDHRADRDGRPARRAADRRGGARARPGARRAAGMAADPNRVPWGNMYEFTLAGTFVVALLYLLLLRRFSLEWMGPLVVGLVLALLMLAVIWLYTPVAPLTEALYSPWLVIHVVSAVIATGAFTLGGICSVLYLLKERSTKERGYLARVPELVSLDRISYRMHAFAFPVWTFAVLITGPIWAHQAWSSYWNWDPKEVWAFITWVVYAAYLHARATVGWKGRNAAYVALVGLATLWFNFIGINFFSTSSQHSYAAPALVEQRPAYDDVARRPGAAAGAPVPPGPPVPPSS